MDNLKDTLAYAAFCTKLMKHFNELKAEYNALSPQNKERLKKDARSLLSSSGLGELLGIEL